MLKYHKFLCSVSGGQKSVIKTLQYCFCCQVFPWLTEAVSWLCPYKALSRWLTGGWASVSGLFYKVTYPISTGQSHLKWTPMSTPFICHFHRWDGQWPPWEPDLVVTLSQRWPLKGAPSSMAKTLWGGTPHWCGTISAQQGVVFSASLSHHCPPFCLSVLLCVHQRLLLTVFSSQQPRPWGCGRGGTCRGGFAPCWPPAPSPAV